MKITKTKTEIVVRMPRKQMALDALGDPCGKVDNLIGIIEGDENGIHQAIDMTYKGGAPQIGERIITTNLEKDEFKKLCQELEIDYEELPICEDCKKPIWGTCTWGKNGYLCYECA